MGIFIIDDKIIESLKTLKEHAEANPFSMEMLEETITGERPIPGDTKEFTRFIPMGFKVVYTIENQDAGMIRHLSMSVDTPGKMPHPHEVIEVMKFLGFEKDIFNCILDLEEIRPGHDAISVLELEEEEIPNKTKN